MDINTIVLIIILAVLLYAMINNSQEKRLNAKKQKERIAAAKAEDSNEEIATYGQVQERKKQLLSLIESNLSEHPDESTTSPAGVFGQSSTLFVRPSKSSSF